jgi:aminopeptidase N
MSQLNIDLTKYVSVLLLIAFGFSTSQSSAQEEKSEPPALSSYQATPTKVNNLIHTKLNVRFDYQKRHLHGQEWITLKPHFYPTDSLRLDAKGMDIKRISLVGNEKHTPLKFTYDGLSIGVKLDRIYKNTEVYIVYVEYTAKPYELNVKNDSRGLYFINPTGKEGDKPTQIWTQGEPENSSAWFPTIDKPNQKTTQEISITVPARYVTLSNGRLANKRINGDGTRTDTWKMELPHAPYLFMLAVGEFAIHKDNWHGKEVSYYVEPKFAPFAKEVFGHTPEAIDFFSKTLGVDYPWYKYAQVVVHDFVSGAMENTTASVFGEDIFGYSRNLTDQANRTGVVHELFHQWFGNYTTMESWSNLTLNESFADFGEIMWLEYKYGKDVADEHVYRGIKGYLENPDARTKSLVRFNYQDKNEVFDGVTYQKGGRILNMLRNYLGKEAFYKGLNLYLKKMRSKTPKHITYVWR